MREKFYGLLREYSLALQERDLCEQRVKNAPQGPERERAESTFESIQARCKRLRWEIRRWPDINKLPGANAADNPHARRRTQGR